MGITNIFKSEDHIDNRIIVSTKKELNDAIKVRYGQITITGDLLKDMKEEYYRKRINGKGWAKMIGGFGLVDAIIEIGVAFVIINPIIGLILGGGALGLFGSAALDKMTADKARKYKIRKENNPDPDSKLVITHIDVINKNRAWMKDAGIVECKDNVDKFNDAIEMKAQKITINKQTLIDAIHDSDSIVPNKLIDLIEKEGKYRGYRIAKQPDYYQFTRIR